MDLFLSILVDEFIKLNVSEAFMEFFLVVIQLGAILAVVVLYFHKLWPFCKDNGRDTGFAAHLRWPVVRLWFKIIAACMPAAVLGIDDECRLVVRYDGESRPAALTSGEAGVRLL